MTPLSSIATRIAVVAPVARAEGVQRVLAALAARGAAARPRTPAELSAPDWLPELAFCRLASGRPAWELSMARAAEHRGLAFVDPPSRLALVHDKALLLAHLDARGVAVPPTICVARDGPVDLSSLPGERFVVKPAQGLAGHGVTTGLDRAGAARAAAAFADLSGPVLVQPLWGDGLDLRLFVVDGQVAACMRRRPATPGGRGSLLYGARAEAHDPLADELALARAAVAATGLAVAGVDLVRDADGRLAVLEVNSCPGLKGIEAATGRDLAGAIADLILRRAAALNGS